jgi:hypothetical protein
MKCDEKRDEKKDKCSFIVNLISTAMSDNATEIQMMRV